MQDLKIICEIKPNTRYLSYFKKFQVEHGESLIVPIG
jgi:hypothetical protein